jgi:predicted amidophosphoribosyltransferase
MSKCERCKRALNKFEQKLIGGLCERCLRENTAPADRWD